MMVVINTMSSIEVEIIIEQDSLSLAGCGLV